jgi:MSHA biogenesis protein MshJ
VNERLTAIAERLDGLEPKERVLLLIATCLVVLLVWRSVGLQRLALHEQSLLSQTAQQQARLAEIEAEAARIVEAARHDPNDTLRAQIAAAESSTATFAAEIRERAGELIEPQQMAAILQSVLEQTRGLEFVSLEGLGAEPLLAPRDAAKDGVPLAEGAETQAFRHGFRVRFNASYLDTLAYLRALEALPWRFFWEAVELEVTAHPQARASVVVYTLSLDRRWIGV